MSDCNLLGNLYSVRQGNLDFQTAPRWFVTSQGWAPVPLQAWHQGSSGHRCWALLQLLCMDDSYSPSNDGVGTTSPHFADEGTGAWISTETCRQWTPQPLYSLPCITKLSFDANLATLEMCYVSQASPATSYKSSHYSMSESSNLIFTISPYLTRLLPCSASCPSLIPFPYGTIGFWMSKGRITSTMGPLGEAVQGLWTLGCERRVVSCLQDLLQPVWQVFLYLMALCGWRLIARKQFP